MPAAAEAYRRAPAQSKGLALLVHNFKVAFHTQWTVVKDGNFRCWQRSLRRFNRQKFEKRYFQDNDASREKQQQDHNVSYALRLIGHVA
jgi:hypothetical protein